MDASTALHLPDMHLPDTDHSGPLRRAGRAVLGSAVALIVGPSALPAHSRACAARFVVDANGTLTRTDR